MTWLPATQAMGSTNIIVNSVLWPNHILSIITFSLTGLCGTTLYFVICLRMPDRSHVQPATVRCTLQAFAQLPTKLGIREMGTWIFMDVGENFMKIEKYVTISIASEARCKNAHICISCRGDHSKHNCSSKKSRQPHTSGVFKKM